MSHVDLDEMSDNIFCGGVTSISDSRKANLKALPPFE